MARKRHSAEQIINKLREAEVRLGQGMSVPEVSRKLGVTEQARKLKDMEKENARLKRLLAEAHLDKAMLQEVASGNF